MLTFFCLVSRTVKSQLNFTRKLNAAACKMLLFLRFSCNLHKKAMLTYFYNLLLRQISCKNYVFFSSILEQINLNKTSAPQTN